MAPAGRIISNCTIESQIEMEGRDAYAEARSDLKRARTILIKIGTEIVHSPDGLLAMGQIGAIVEQVRCEPQA